jgi:hypothetical protein
VIGIVKLALGRPYTFVVMAVLILIAGVSAALRTPTDIFPDIDIPVVAVVWSYTGLSPDDMSGRIVGLYERALTTTVNDVEHIESNSEVNYGIVKIFFQPTADIQTALAQVTAVSQTVPPAPIARCTSNCRAILAWCACRRPPLILANQGAQVALVGADGKVALKPITLRRDFGDSVEVVAGVSPTD